MTAITGTTTFYGWRVVGAAFVLAVFAWGLGFYGPPIYLHAVQEARGWPLALVSTAVTLHFLVGAIFAANLPRLYARFGVPGITKAGAVSLAAGVTGWAVAQEPWQLLAATLLSGAGWIAMSAAAINAIIAPWFQRARPAALSMAYNGASIGGVVFSPLWVAAIGLVGFPVAAAVIGMVTAVAVWILADLVFSKTPQQMGLTPDGDAPGVVTGVTSPSAKPLPGALLWRDIGFITLAAGMALGLFAQIGLLAHLFSLLVPALGAQSAGLALGGATAAAIAGRTLVGWLMPAAADRRLVAVASYPNLRSWGSNSRVNLSRRS
jgi:MFS family permease